jgi:hypothetical protein
MSSIYNKIDDQTSYVKNSFTVLNKQKFIIFLFLIYANFYFLFLFLQQEKVYKKLPEKDLDELLRLENQEGLSFENKSNRLFCIILSTAEAQKTTKPLTILTSWAIKCDNYKFVTLFDSNLTLSKLRIKNIHSNDTYNFSTSEYENEIGSPLNLIQPTGLVEDAYNKLTLKVMLAFREIYTRYGNDYDWWLKADLDTFIHTNNLIDFLSEKDPFEPVTFGYDYKVIVKNGYHSGGAGYVLSKESFNRLGEKLVNNVSYCHNSGNEDVDVHACLRTLGVYPNKSIDDFGRERFHMIDLRSSYFGDFRDGMDGYAANPLKKVNLLILFFLNYFV